MEKFIFFTFSILLISGCASVGSPVSQSTTLIKSDKKAETNNKKNNLQVNPKNSQFKFKNAPSFNALLPGFTFLKKPRVSATNIDFWITYEQSASFHVPWYIGGDWFSAKSEKLVVDPVNKTVSLDFESAKTNGWSCLKGGRLTDRDLEGYTVCSSQFSIFPVSAPIPKLKERTLWEKLFEKPKVITPSNTVSVNVDQSHIAMVIKQLNLVTRAEDQLKGGKESPASRKHRMKQTLEMAQDRYQSQLLHLQNIIISEYNSAAKQKDQVVKRTIMDKSGFYNYDIEWVDPIRIVPHKIKEKRFDYSAFLKEFNKLEITDASQPIVNLLVSRMRHQYDKDKKSLIRFLKSETQNYTVKCSYPKNNGDYQVVSTCPSTVSLAQGVFNLPVKFEILKRKFGTTIPAFNSVNSDLSVSADDTKIKFHNNLPEKSITIDRVDWMANDVTATLAGGGYFPIRLGPGESKSIPLARFINKEIKASLKVSWMSRRSAIRKAVYYGFDVHYVQGGTKTVTEKHLAQKTKYKLSDLLLSRF